MNSETLAQFPLLAGINQPSDLRALPSERLPELARELRDYLILTVSESGGHFAAGLGVVELTVALHYAFATPEDRLVWDTGHQAYPHKVLTGRRDSLASIRKKDGLSGFPRRSESVYDTFGVAHAGTSISAAMGMAEAARRSGRRVVAVIGDGGLTAGMAFEALNHAGNLGSNLLVVLNDNEMSISPSVGALYKYLTRLRSDRHLRELRDTGRQFMRHLPFGAGELLENVEEHAKGLVMPGTLFEQLGFNYYGPLDGHDVPGLVRALERLRDIPGPKLLHINTVKGKGYSQAEADPVAYHGVGTFDPSVGLPAKKPAASLSYTQVFGRWLCDMAGQDDRLVGITPAMREGSGLVEFERRFPERYYDAAIAEQHAVTLAAGMACDGLKPVVAIYSTFLQRGYDQLVHDVALQDLDVTFALDRAGIVGPDGATHAGCFDHSFLRCIPNMVLMAPADEDECRQMLYTGFVHKGPAAVRYPRGNGPGVEIREPMQALPLGRGELRRTGTRVALLSFGSLLDVALAVADEIDATVANMRFVKPLDAALVQELAASHELLVTLEDNVVAGGAGSGVSELLAAEGVLVRVLHLGLPDGFVEHGSREQILADCGLDADSILARIRPLVDRGEHRAEGSGRAVGRR